MEVDASGLGLGVAGGDLADERRGREMRDALVFVLAEELNETVLLVDQVAEEEGVHVEQH